MLRDDEIPFDAYVAQVLEIVPDVLPTHVFSLLEQHFLNHKEQVVEFVLHALFENPDYPKADAKGKGKRKREDPELDVQAGRAVKPKIDYGDKNRKQPSTKLYYELAIVSARYPSRCVCSHPSQHQLEIDFPEIPALHINAVFADNRMLYAPSYLALRVQLASADPPFQWLSRPRAKGRSKGKRAQRYDEDFDAERQWILDKLEEEQIQGAAGATQQFDVPDEPGIECGCCFTDYPFVRTGVSFAR